MINAIIVDDEINNSNYLKGLLESNLPEVKLIGVASNVNDAIKLITGLKPDLVFFRC
jgi:YesN/AraC family two-component response regulator